MTGFPRLTEREVTIADAKSSEGKSPEERMAMFFGILAMVDAIWVHLTPEDRARRRRIAQALHRRPEPWWRNVKPDVVKEAECRTSPP